MITFEELNESINEYYLIRLIMYYTGKPVRCIVCGQFNEEDLKICVSCFDQSIEYSPSQGNYIRKWISYIPRSECKSCKRIFGKTVGLKYSYFYGDYLEHRKFCEECFNLSLNEYYRFKKDKID